MRDYTEAALPGRVPMGPDVKRPSIEGICIEASALAELDESGVPKRRALHRRTFAEAGHQSRVARFPRPSDADDIVGQNAWDGSRIDHELI